jgi:hypothetical protein
MTRYDDLRRWLRDHVRWRRRDKGGRREEAFEDFKARLLADRGIDLEQEDVKVQELVERLFNAVR